MDIKWGSVKALGLALCMAGAVIANPAMAADLDPPVFEQTEVTEVEFGSGWYIRGDIGVGISELEDSEVGNLGHPVKASAAVGYSMTENVRLEAALGFYQNLASRSTGDISCGTEPNPNDPNGGDIPITGDCYSVSESEPWAANLMANVYYDLPEFGSFQPYVGAGAGFGFVRRGPLERAYYCRGDNASDCGVAGGAGVNQIGDTDNFETDGQFVGSFNAMAGVSYSLTQNTKLDLGYRFTYLGGSRRYADRDEADAWTMNEVTAGIRVELW
ncbi:outer membrane protein [Pseudahrensia aquimaris]|uniref:Outer membrane protein n=1 Tax=Pseudahrensia aquimaris TaxID=744461 RepID=A0ABW3FBQ0_9HYPH